VLSIYHKSKIRHEKLEREKVSIESQRLQEQLEYRNKEVVIIMMNLYERNELIRQVIQKLKSIMPDVKKAAQPQLEAIVLDLKGRYHENIVSEFEQRFQKVHSNFYSNLSSQYPSLTAYDLRLCAFLRMNMNTKDIASLTHQTVNSVEVARTRLRKKLNLHQTDTDLAAFLAKF
jgi:DNA-binding NarL/FixJ family response regulator